MKQIYATILVTFAFIGIVRANQSVVPPTANMTPDSDIAVFANDITPLLGHLTVNNNDYITLKASTNAQGNYFEFSMENNLHVKAWLITADSTTLPYIPVTKKEYLQQARKELVALKALAVADTRVRTSQTIGGYNQTIRLIDSIRRNSTPLQLSQPAVVSTNAANFHGFEDGKANTTMLVRMNSAYFTGSNQQAPKCLLVCYRYNPAESLVASVDHQPGQNFDSRPFQALLGR